MIGLTAGVVLTLCSQFLFLQGAVASEGARQPFAAQVDIARAARNVACDYGAENYLAGLREARLADERGDFTNHHWRAYHALYSFDPALREPWARAAYIALTEDPPIPVKHFVQLSTSPSWWDRACHETWAIGDHKFCR